MSEEAPAEKPAFKNEVQNGPACPKCGSTKLYKDGLRYLANGAITQRWVCRNCCCRFTERNCNSSDTFQYVQKIHTHALNSPEALTINCQGSREASSRAPTGLSWLVQTLAEVEPQINKRAAGATEQTADVKGKLVEFIWWMKKQGYSDATIEGRARVLRVLMKRGANLLDPESVKDIIARQKWSEGRKANAVKAYTNFLKMVGGTWQPPICRDVRKIPFIPLEREIDDLIASCNQYIAAFLRIGKETGARAGEIYNLRWSDIDFERQTIRITAEKNSNPRIFRISNILIAMLNKLPKDNERIFHHYKSLKHLRRCFQRYRKRAALKLGNPRILQITFHTLRHWKGTMEYAKTKDILHVMQVLGHKKIQNTLIYTQLVKNIREDEYICKIAKTPSEIQELIENGFEFVCQKDDMAFFRKRK
jgi:integrase